MRPDRVAREHLGALQGELLRALWGLAPVPRGFDGPGVLAEGKSLSKKRHKTVAKVRPALARALGRRLFRECFSTYAASHPLPEHACADATAFTRWLFDQLGDEDLIERMNWQVGLRAVLAASPRGTSDPEVFGDVRADLRQLTELLDEIRRRRGPGATQQPRLKAALVIGSLGALGVDLDGATVAMLRREIVRQLESSSAARPSNHLEAVLSSLRASLGIERVLSRRLRPDQRELYLSHTGEDPFFDQDVPRIRLDASRPEVLREALLSYWRTVLALADSAIDAARAVARTYAEGTSATASASLGCATASRREALLERAIGSIELQIRSEEKLANDPGLSPAERARVGQVRGSVLFDVVAVEVS
jgi:hypothetical protein